MSILNESPQPRQPAAAQPLRADETKPLEGGASFSLANRLERMVWKICWTLLARWTPPFWSPWRNRLLRLFGAQLHPTAAVVSSVSVWLPRHLKMAERSTIGPGVDCYNMAMITIGKETIISQRAVLCAGSHDIASKDFQLIAKEIVIGDKVWIGAEAFVGPGVSIGEGAVLGARGCAFSALAPWTVYVGNPARSIKPRRFRQES